MNNQKIDVLNNFWSMYENEGIIQALSWFDTLKYYEDYCIEKEDIINKLKKMEI
jgi:hypothetical protein